MRLSPSRVVLVAVCAVLASGLGMRPAWAGTVPDALSLDNLVGVFPAGGGTALGSFSPVSFNAANTPYSSGQIGMVVSFAGSGATQAAVVASAADGGNATGYDNTPATVTLAASGNALVTAAAVPEPAALLLVPVGVLGLLAARRRRA